MYCILINRILRSMMLVVAYLKRMQLSFIWKEETNSGKRLWRERCLNYLIVSYWIVNHLPILHNLDPYTFFEVILHCKKLCDYFIKFLKMVLPNAENFQKCMMFAVTKKMFVFVWLLSNFPKIWVEYQQF